MKIRQSFVSNSSTSSYLIYGKQMDLKEYNDVRVKLGAEPAKALRYSSSVEINLNGEEYGFRYHEPEEGDTVSGIMIMNTYTSMRLSTLRDKVDALQEMLLDKGISTSDWALFVGSIHD